MAAKENPGRVHQRAGVEKPNQASAAGFSIIPNNRAQRQHHETADDYGGIVALLCDGCRVVVCKDRIQWILQRRDAQRAGRARWKAFGYFVTRDALIRVSRTLCERLDPGTLAILAALPDCIGGVA